MSNIHPAAIVSGKARIGQDVRIGPFSVIEDGVTVQDGCDIGPSVHLQGNTEIGPNCRIFTGAVIGGLTQDLKYRGGESFVKIGRDNTIREYVTVNSGTAGGESTVIGSNNLLMAYVHVAHNCLIGNNVIIANAGTLAGHVVIEDFVILGGLTGVHQFCRIGKHAIIGGCSKVTKDIVPFAMADGHPAVPMGLNKIGLRRRDFSPERIDRIETAYRILFRSGLNVSEALAKIEETEKSEDVSYMLEFVRRADRGIAK